MTAVGPGVVSALYRYPVKSLQGGPEDRLDIGPHGVVGDRRWGLVDAETGKLASAKRFSVLFEGVGHDDSLDLPGGVHVALDDADLASPPLSAWLGREVRIVQAGDGGSLFPEPEGALVDLAPIHLVTAATLQFCATRWPHLDWDVRRFRPNLVVDIDIEPFSENGWVGRELRVGQAILRVDQPTMRCAMPLRSQPGLAAQPELFAALNEANPALPNHLGLYLGVSHPGSICVGDPLTLC